MLEANRERENAVETGSTGLSGLIFLEHKYLVDPVNPV
jgi:hypothetical protein